VSARRRGARPAVDVTVDDGVAWLTLDREATRNRLDAELSAAVADACERVEDDAAVRVVVLASRGPVFCAGLPRGIAAPPSSWPDAVGAVGALTKPVIAALAGEVCGVGVGLALACDLRIASSSATFVLPEAREGHLPPSGIVSRLTRLIGPARAFELALLGGRLPARRAAEWGVVTRVVPPAGLRKAAATAARALAVRGPLALRLGKEAVTRALDLPLGDGMRLEHDLYVLLQTTADRAEGVKAFLERRQPRFIGR
jgi:enoyl-CoA hydratase/carnithine racemase